MKKRFFALLTALVLMTSVMAVNAAAAETGRFSDVSDRTTATAVEVLRLMGVLDGYGDGTFRPNAILTRAQFCKMAVYAMDGGDELGRYRTVTIFPDVKPSHWAASYINMAAKGKSIIAGYPDGRFYPDRTVTVGHAATILLRLLGYKDEDIGGVWPDSYMAAAASIGLADGVGTNGSAPLTRAQAARLFLNLLRTKNQEGATLYTLGDETDLVSIDGGAGELKTSDGTVYTMVNPVASSTLVGLRGQVVTNGKGEALTFLPASSGSTGISNAAVIVYEGRSTAGFDALAGNSDYTIYKNGQKASASDLRKYDVATYYAATNTIRVCDTRITVYYEDCSPSPSSPTKLMALGHEFSVLPTAVDSVADFKPGDQVTLLLTADGQVAGAVEASGTGARGNAMAVVKDGAVQLLCGGSILTLEGIETGEEYEGQAVRISSGSKNAVSLSIQKGSVSGDLDVSARKLGSKALAENVMIFDGGTLTGLNQLTQSKISASQIVYARTNWAGEVDLVVLDRTSGDIYGRVFVEVTEGVDAETGGSKRKEAVGVEFGNGASDRKGPYETNYSVRNGKYVVARINRGGTDFTYIEELTALKGVSNSAWVGDKAVTCGGRTYTVPEDVLCYNADADRWITLEAARDYADSADLYVRGGVVRIIEVSSK